MLEAGALEEVSALLERGSIRFCLPCVRMGYPSWRPFCGEVPLEEARKSAVLAIGRYTRRQATWFRHHALGKGDDGMISLRRYTHSAQESESQYEK